MLVALSLFFPRLRGKWRAKRVDGGPLRLARWRARSTSPVNGEGKLHHDSRQMAEIRLLFFPVTMFLRPWFAWRFQEITGEIFFARSLRRGRAGTNAGKSAGRRSPVPKGQVSDFI